MRETYLYFFSCLEKLTVLIFLPSSVTFSKNNGRVNYIVSNLGHSSRLVFGDQSLLFTLFNWKSCFILAHTALPFFHSSTVKNLCEKAASWGVWIDFFKKKNWEKQASLTFLCIKFVLYSSCSFISEISPYKHCFKPTASLALKAVWSIVVAWIPDKDTPSLGALHLNVLLKM